MNILVLCTGNSARSVLLEAIFNRHGAAHGIRAFSAGSKPAGKVHPETLRLLSAKGYATAGLRSKSWDEFAAPDAPVMDAVITVCGSAAGEACPFWPGAPARAHWGVEDPAAAARPDQPAAFEETYGKLLARANALLSVPPPELTPARLGAELARIGLL